MKRKTRYRTKEKTAELPIVDDEITTTSEPEPETKKDDTKPVPVVKRQLVNIYSNRVVVRPETTPSGNGYDVKDGATFTVEVEDYHYLLSLGRDPGPGCCGGLPPEQRTRYYFGVLN
jgi:hypothetical protein